MTGFEYFFSSIKNIWKIEDLRYKIGITLGFLLVYRFSSYVPLPGINPQGIYNFMENVNTGEKGLLQIIYSFSGGAFSRASVLALGIMPYISSSIFVHLISLIFPYLKKDGESSLILINRIIRMVTVIICLIQAPTYCNILTTKFIPFSYAPKAYLLDLSIYWEKVFFWVISIVVLTVGTFFTIWIGENITDKGIGNGVSLIIMSGIIDRFPNALYTEIVSHLGASGGLFFLFFECLLWLLIVCFCIMVIQAVRKVPVQYVGSNQKQNSIITMRHYIPLKVISVGVMPIIFAQSIMLFTMMFSSHLRSTFKNVYGFWYNLVFSIFIIFFTFFYTALTIPVHQITDDLKRDGGHIPKVKPGKETLDYLDNILAVITIPGSFLLVIIAILPSFIVKIGVTKNLALFYGGTSLLIIVGSVLDTMQQIDPYFLNNHYDILLSLYHQKLWKNYG
ncbi:MAG TPA: preprotein translocase subunit SecY [Candidatus Angelobacter sp.]|jgi:preprotein translocase subunit SecY|nr:preprotein translocase subunit SecY [Candidatus Angelobacter sp.]